MFEQHIAHNVCVLRIIVGGKIPFDPDIIRFGCE